MAADRKPCKAMKYGRVMPLGGSFDLKWFCQ
jgi:hypothetical protein